MRPTRRLSIKEVNRGHPIGIVDPKEFITEPGAEISAQEVVCDPKFSLYCLDPENDSVLFVECDDPAAVDRAPFYYQAQRENAIGLVTMPVDTFHTVGNHIAEPSKGLILIHSVGRCGSTLLSKVLAAQPSVHSLSEPDDLSQMVFLRGDGASDEWLRQMLVSSVRWRCKPRVGAPAEHVAIKTRSEVLVLGDLIGSSFPRAKHFFLYRDAISWMGSIVRGWSPERDVYDVEKNLKMEESWARTLPLVGQLRSSGTLKNAVQIRLLAWVSCVEEFLKLAELGIPTQAARFEDLTRSTRPILEEFFAFCKIDAVDWTAIDAVMERDSQAGTIYDREKRREVSRKLTDDQVQDIRDLIASRPKLVRPDVIVPGTILP